MKTHTDLANLSNILNLQNTAPASEEEKKVLAATEKIGGHFLPAEIVSIYRLAKYLPEGSKILEIGSYRGRSSNAFGHAIIGTDKRLFCLDIWKNFDSQPTGPRDTDKSAYQLAQTDFAVFEDFLNNTEWFSNNLNILRGSTEELKAFLPKDFFNFIFIDAAHDYKSVCADIDATLGSLAPGGIIGGHDYHEQGAGVVKAVNEKVFQHPQILSYGTIGGTGIWLATFQ